MGEVPLQCETMETRIILNNLKWVTPVYHQPLRKDQIIDTQITDSPRQRFEIESLCYRSPNIGTEINFWEKAKPLSKGQLAQRELTSRPFLVQIWSR